MHRDAYCTFALLIFGERRTMVDFKVTDAMLALIRTAICGGGDLTENQIQTVKAELCEIYEIARRNDMAHLVGLALEANGLYSPGEELFENFQKYQYLAIYRYEGMKYETERIREAFEKEKIDFILLKGAVVRKLYPEEWMRTSGDVDVLVRHEDIDRAEKVLIEHLGYKKDNDGTHDRSFCTTDDIHIELHFDLVEDHYANASADVLADAWESAVRTSEGGCEYELSREMFYFYHIAHLAKHFEYAGMGIRPFIDLWLINKKMPPDASGAETLIKKGGLERFCLLCEALSKYWMEGIDPPEDVKRLEEFVLECGIYGSEENKIAIDRKRHKGIFRYVLGRVFMPYAMLAELYPIILKHKWLVPFCQIARWFKIVASKRAKSAFDEIKANVAVSEVSIDKMQELLDYMGLAVHTEDNKNR